MALYQSSKITFTANAPTGTTLKIEINVSLNGGSAWLGWVEVQNDDALPHLTLNTDISNLRVQSTETPTTNNLAQSAELTFLKIEVASVSPLLLATHNCTPDVVAPYPITLVEITDNPALFPAGSPTQGFYRDLIIEHPEASFRQTESLFGLLTFEDMVLRIANQSAVITESKHLRGYHVRVWRRRNGANVLVFQGTVRRPSIGPEATLTLSDKVRKVLNEKILRPITLAEFPLSRDPGSYIFIAAGRVSRLGPCPNIEWNPTAKKYYYCCGEGVGYAGGKWKALSRAYTGDFAMQVRTGIVQTVTASNKFTLHDDDRMPDDWYVDQYVSWVGTIPRYVTDYKEDTNEVTLDSNPSSPPQAGTTQYTIKPWRFWDGGQIPPDPFPGVAFVEFRNPPTLMGNILPIYVDGEALEGEKNYIRMTESLFSNPKWGKGITVNTAWFNEQAGLPEIASLLCEGAITNGDRVLMDVLGQLLMVRGIGLLNTDIGIGIVVDIEKNSVANFGLGDGHYNNIQKDTLSNINMLEEDDLVKDLTAYYRFDFKKGDYLCKDIKRQSSAQGLDKTIELPFTYSAGSADRIVDYLRKIYKEMDGGLSFTGRMEEGVLSTVMSIVSSGASAFGTPFRVGFGAGGAIVATRLIKGKRVSVNVPSRSINRDYKIVDTNILSTQLLALELNRYDPMTRTYEPWEDLGTIDDQDNLPVPPNFENTPSQPVSNFDVVSSYDIQPDNSIIVFMDATWDPPEENYSESRFEVRKVGQTVWEPRGARGYDRMQMTGFQPGTFYDIKITPYNVTGTQPGISTIESNVRAGGNPPAPATPTGLTGYSKGPWLGWSFNRSSDPGVKEYKIRVWTTLTGGVSPVESSVIEQPPDTASRVFWEYLAQTGNLNNFITRYAEVAAIEHTGKESPYTIPRRAAMTSEINQDDIGQDQITRKGFYANAGAINIVAGPPGQVNIATASINAIGGLPILIWFNCELASSNDVAAVVTIQIERDNSGIALGQIRQYMRDVNSIHAIALQMSEVQLTPGLHTYRIYANLNVNQASLTKNASQRSLLVLEVGR